MNRDLWATLVASFAVLLAVILGFRALGGPGTQRLIQSDRRTVQTLAQLAQKINSRWHSSAKGLPANLDQVPGAEQRDPITHQPLLYHPKFGSEYELCATFATDSRDQRPQNPNGKDEWAHPKGAYCFQLDASQQVPQAPYNYTY
jgi:hypothetical protein